MNHEQTRVNFDWTINISSIGSIILLILTIASYANKTLNYVKSIDNKVTIMWIDFAKTHPEAARELLALENREKD